jgi:type IV pilus assembly protein PilW
MIVSKMRTPMDAPNAERGFTMVELLISMIVTSILGAAVVTNYATQQDASTTVRQVSQIQQQLRGSTFIMEQDLRITGYDPQSSGLFGVLDVRRYNITDEVTQAAPTAGGSPSITVAYDWDPAPAVPGLNANGLLEEPTPAYRLFDDNNDGIFDLVRDNDNGALNRQLVAEGFEAIGFAYAFDADGDGALDRTPAGNIIWAVDSDNDNRLDTNLDATGDGIIDLNDDTDGDFRIGPADGAGLATPVTVNRIRMVRIWLLARARTAARNFTNTGQSFLVGDQVVPNVAGGFTDKIRRRLLIRTVQCRNTGI